MILGCVGCGHSLLSLARDPECLGFERKDRSCPVVVCIESHEKFHVCSGCTPHGHACSRC
jgi:hypothetical protein